MKSPFRYALNQIRQAQVSCDPFAHVLVAGIFPDEFYQEVLSALPKPKEFKQAEYPGTGFGRRVRNYHSFGLLYPELDSLPVLGEVAEFLRSEEFCRVLLTKFSDPADGVPAIPPDKYRFFVDGARHFTPVLDLHIDLPGYEIPPHRDVEEKIVTFQFYLSHDSSLRDFGTFLCKPKAPRADGSAERSSVACAAGAVIAFAARSLRLTDTSLWRKFQRTTLAMEIGLGVAATWFPWRLFEIAKIAPALPNHFLAFAPNHRSYHAVRLNLPPDSPVFGRTVIRGFLRTGRDAINWTRISKAASASA